MTVDLSTTDPETARVAAAKQRSGWLVGLSSGEATFAELVGASCDPLGKPLRRLRLSTVLQQLLPGGAKTEDSRWDRIERAMGVPRGGLQRTAKIQWLLSGNADTCRRIAVIADALTGDIKTRGDTYASGPWHLADVLGPQGTP